MSYSKFKPHNISIQRNLYVCYGDFLSWLRMVDCLQPERRSSEGEVLRRVPQHEKSIRILERRWRRRQTWRLRSGPWRGWCCENRLQNHLKNSFPSFSLRRDGLPLDFWRLKIAWKLPCQQEKSLRLRWRIQGSQDFLGRSKAKSKSP